MTTSPWQKAGIVCYFTAGDPLYQASSAALRQADLMILVCGCNLYCHVPSSPCSLIQWLAHQKTCPQCRERCLQRNVVKLFVDSGDSSMLNTTQSMEPHEMKVGRMGIRSSAQNWEYTYTCILPTFWGPITFQSMTDICISKVDGCQCIRNYVQPHLINQEQTLQDQYPCIKVLSKYVNPLFGYDEHIFVEALTPLQSCGVYCITSGETVSSRKPPEA